MLFQEWTEFVLTSFLNRGGFWSWTWEEGKRCAYRCRGKDMPGVKRLENQCFSRPQSEDVWGTCGGWWSRWCLWQISVSMNDQWSQFGGQSEVINEAGATLKEEILFVWFWVLLLPSFRETTVENPWDSALKAAGLSDPIRAHPGRGG